MKPLKIVIGTFFGIGMLPGFPGTWGSLFTLPLVFLIITAWPVYGLPCLFLTCSILSLWCAPAAVDKYGEDPPAFVMDECAGQSLVFLIFIFRDPAGLNFFLLAAGFVFFRLFDIIKPLGINRLQKLPGKFGILCDDLLAGFYAMLCLELTRVLSTF